MKSFFILLGSLILVVICILPFVADYFRIMRRKYGKPLPKKEIKFLLFLIIILILVDIIFIFVK